MVFEGVGGKGWMPRNRLIQGCRKSHDCERDMIAVVKKVSCKHPGQKSMKDPVMAGNAYTKMFFINGAIGAAAVPTSPPFCGKRVRTFLLRSNIPRLP